MAQTKLVDSLVILSNDRTLEEKLTDIISASDYGATVAGSAAANTTAINNAITAAENTGGFVLIAPGITYTESSLVIPDSVTLIVIGLFGTVTFLVKNQGQSAIAKGGIAIKSQNHTGVLLRAIDQDVTAEPMVQVVDATNGDLAAVNTSFVEMNELSGLTAPASNKARLYCADNGSGKTRLLVQFPTGAVQVIATEP
jgi:hypothetical protein